ncbi:metal ABC transporter ATP-binding protein [Gluconobacter japonicus]|nr:metal ABC transporter ATP-binding protein [Gluconobacter japonicus]
MAHPDNLFLDGVTLCAGHKTILDHVTLTVPITGMTLLAGRNGSGKSTFLKACLGLVRLQNGVLLVKGQPPETACKQIGYMPQSLNDAALMIPAISHVMAAMNGAQWGVSLPSRSRRENAERLLALTGALSFARRPLGLLSGGERQRVCLAQALTDNPKTLLLDEPLAALDHEAQHQIVSLLDTLTRELGISILITSHETEALDGKVSRILKLENGSLHV